MGCGASTAGAISNRQHPYTVLISETWNKAHDTCKVKKGQRNKQKLVVRRTGWKTVRIFVSSTFRDFQYEREVLVKKVFPDLRAWCENRRLQLIECDLRWGVPKDFTTEATLQACLGEIDRCYQDNVMPFFINMTSERIGWIPAEEEIPETMKETYKWVKGLSVTEMEIMHGAYRNDNPNALFLLRDPSFINTVPEKYKERFVDNQDIAPFKIDFLKKMIKDRFPGDRLKYYKVDYLGFNETTNIVELGGLEGQFANCVFEFFKERIEKQYPVPEGDPDPYMQMFEQHDSFMNSRSESVIGRDNIMKQIEEYISGAGNDVPFLLSGGPGSGKSSIMAKVADICVKQAGQGLIPGGGADGWHVFYHFVGAVPGSTELELMLKRLLREMGVVTDATMPTNLDSAAQETTGALNNPRTRPTIIIVDALNQFDSEKAAELMTWVPRKLAPQIRCVFSMIPDTPPHKALLGKEPTPKELQVSPLDEDSKKEIVETMLGKYNKRLDSEQMASLLGKESSQNPLWLSIACEELRVFGQFRLISDKINQMADGLLELEMQVLSRFENENGGNLLVAALCCLEVSQRGLLETELLEILAEEETIMPPEGHQESSSKKDDNKSEKAGKSIEKLPAYKWSEVYRALKPFLRPFGDSGEGRLDFYHRSLSKAVRKKYFQNENEQDKIEIYNFWHDKLADFFELSSNINRKLEEYPGHLIYLKDVDRLCNFLTDWKVFDELYDEEFSTKLIRFWTKGADYDVMVSSYSTVLENMANNPSTDSETMSRAYEKISRLFGQTGKPEKATELLAKAQRLEEEELGARPEKLVELYYLAGFIDDEKTRKEGYYEDFQIPTIVGVVKNYEKSCEIRRKMTGTLNKFKLANTLNRMAFNYADLNEREEELVEDHWQSDEPLNLNARALQAIDESVETFKELNDGVYIADALITKAVCQPRGSSDEIKLYHEALDMILPLTGELHYSIWRIYLNVGIYHEDRRELETAFDWYQKWYTMSKDLYGHDHPKTKRAIDTLRQYSYRTIANRRGIPVPDEK